MKLKLVEDFLYLLPEDVLERSYDHFPWTDLDTIMVNVRMMEMSTGDYE